MRRVEKLAEGVALPGPSEAAVMGLAQPYVVDAMCLLGADRSATTSLILP